MGIANALPASHLQHDVQGEPFSAASFLANLVMVVQGHTTADEIFRPHRYAVHFPEHTFRARASNRERYLKQVQLGYRIARRRSVRIGIMIRDRIDLAPVLVARMQAMMDMFDCGHVVILGEDSTDGTEKVIRQWSHDDSDRVTSLRCTKAELDTLHGLTGIERIAALRNRVLGALVEGANPSDYLCMVDGDLAGPVSLDGLAHSVAELEQSNQFDGLCALGVNNWVGLDAVVPLLGYSYYDPFAFRERDWARTRADAAVRLRLGGLRRGDAVLPVLSGFAGMALYRAESVKGLRYTTDGGECEHVGFHKAYHQAGKRLGLNPSLLLLSGRQGHHHQR